MSSGTKKMYLVFGVVFAFVLVTATLVLADWSFFGRAEEEIHLIRNGYIGPVAIAFDRDDGAQKKYEKKSRIYEIPLDGVLKTKFSKNDGTDHIWRFYYVDAAGAKRQLPYFLDLRKVPAGNQNDIAIYSIGSLSAPNRQGKDKSFFTYVVGKASDSKSLIDRQHNINFGDL